MKKANQRTKTITNKTSPTAKVNNLTPQKAWYLKSTFWFKVALFSFAFILYGNTMKNGYSLDDLYVTYNNPVVNKGIEAIPYILSSRYINVNAEEGGTMNFGYRPLTKVMFALEHQFFGEDPSTSHLINILLYGFTLLIMFSVLRLLMQNYSIWFPFAITMIWASLPVHTEVVASLKNREEIISFLFGLLALKSYIAYARKNSYVALLVGTLWFILSGFAKPSTIPLLVAIPFTIFFFMNVSFRKIGIITFSMVIISFFAIVLLRIYLPESNRPVLFFENPLLFENNFLVKVATGLYGLLMYLKLLVYPHPLLFYYGYNSIPVVNFSNLWVLLSIAIHLSLFIFAIVKLREKHILSYAILFYLIVISMYSNIVKQPAGIIAERFLYIASLGFSIAVAYFLFTLTKVSITKVQPSKNILRVILLSFVILVPFTARTIIRNKDWNSQLSLFSHDIKYLSTSAKANYIYATTLKTALIEQLNAGNQNGTEEQVEKIGGLLKQTVKIYPGYFEAWNSLGEMYAMMKNDYDSALIYFKRTVKEKPTFAAGWYNLGYAYFQKEDFYQALSNFRKAAQLDTTNIKALSNLAMCYNKNGLIDSAIFTNNKIIRKMPNIEIPYLNNASFYLARRDSINAVLWLEKAADVNPNNTSVTTILSKYYAGKGNKEKADLYSSLNNNAQKQP